MGRIDYDSKEWGELFQLDSSSPSGLTWKVDRFAGSNKLATWKGKHAGYLSLRKDKTPRGWVISMKNSDGSASYYYAHRIIACLQGLSVNGKVIDHINGNSGDNSLVNIRVTSLEGNAQNQKVRFNSSYGIQGVNFSSRHNNDYFVASFGSGHNCNSRWFSIKKLGIMIAFRNAVIYRQKGITSLNSNGACYTDRHTGMEELKLKTTKEQYETQ